MKTLRRLTALALIAFLPIPAAAVFFDHKAFDEVLRKYVDEDGTIDYSSIRENSMTALESYFERLAEADLAGWPQRERLAFWINAYNARVLYLIARRPKLKKITEDFEMFNLPFKVGGQYWSANDIKHRILRGTTNPDNKKGPIEGVTMPKRDPLIHFALCNGAVGSPRLRSFAYTPADVDFTLLENAGSVVNDPKFVNYRLGGWRLSTLFKWYAEDFQSAGGVPTFLRHTLSDKKRKNAEELQDALDRGIQNARYEFDWTVNDPRERGKAIPQLRPHLVPEEAASISQPAAPEEPARFLSNRPDTPILVPRPADKTPLEAPAMPEDPASEPTPAPTIPTAPTDSEAGTR